jgi:protein gp37
MAQKTKIEWTDATWNPVVGCRRVSEGCRNCYAKALHDKRHEAYLAGKRMPAQYSMPFEQVQLMSERLDLPLRWRTPRRIFVNSMSDLFHDDVPFEFIDQVVDVVRRAFWHTFQVLTKRARRMIDWYEHWIVEINGGDYRLPLNLWLGVSVEDQRTADERVSELMCVHGARRFVSCEPLLGPVNLRQVVDAERGRKLDALGGDDENMRGRLDWVIVGGESGAGARPMHPDWVRALRDQCRETGVPFFFKQWGEWVPLEHLPWVMGRTLRYRTMVLDGVTMCRVGRALAGYVLDGEVWREVPVAFVAF